MRAVVVVPTYQEAPNVERFMRTVREQVPEVDLVVVDDSSPDGTGEIAEKVAADIGRADVIHRPRKEGLGAAYRQGFRAALDAGYDVVVQMDCDFSHDPRVIATLLGLIEDGADCAIGSRYIAGGSTPGWPLHRRLLSRWGNRYTGFVLKLPIRDTTGGFRAYRASTLERIHIDATKANGYAFQNETAFRMVQAHLDLRETPIAFVDREAGTSKMSVKIMAESLWRVTTWGAKLRLGRSDR